MLFNEAVQEIIDAINTIKPKYIHPSWIHKQTPKSYRYFCIHLKCSLGYIDWDEVTRALPYEHQKKWCRFRKRRNANHGDADELCTLIREYNNLLYVFVSAQSKEERVCRERITIRFVRLAQNGNEAAREYIYDLLYSMVCDWIRDYKSLWVLNGYNDIIEKQIHGCIRRFRYAGSFTTYLYRTLQYASLGLRSLERFSLDEPYRDGNGSRMDLVVKNEDTGEIEIFKGGFWLDF